MHTELAALLNEPKKATHVTAKHCHDQSTPILKWAAAVQQQLAKYRQLLIDAEMSPDADPNLAGRLERLHQKTNAADKDIRDVLVAVRRVNRSMAGFES